MEVFTGKNNTVFPGCWSVNNTLYERLYALYYCFFYSQGAAFGVGEYYENNGSIRNNSHLYWLNNFTTIGRSYGK